MPPRKEPKETVIYPSSKRKAPPFKPQRPSKVPRIPTTESESTNPKSVPKATARKQTSTTASQRKPSVQSTEDDEIEATGRTAADQSSDEDSDEELDENPLTARQRPSKPSKSTKLPAAPMRRAPRDPSPISESSQHSPTAPSPKDSPAASAVAEDPPPPEPSQSDVPSIPQPLLVRILHEHFADKNTKIDKHAIQVLQKYFEVFVRETIARAALRKREDAESGGGEDVDVGWLELEDLENVAGGMMLDF